MHLSGIFFIHSLLPLYAGRLCFQLCMSVQTVTFECTDLETLFLVGRFLSCLWQVQISAIGLRKVFQLCDSKDF